jgi:hypothetical protein
MLPVIIAQDVDRKKVVLDAKPVSDGWMTLEEAGDGVLIAHAYSKGWLDGMTCDRYRTHFNTCRDRQAR